MQNLTAPVTKWAAAALMLAAAQQAGSCTLGGDAVGPGQHASPPTAVFAGNRIAGGALVARWNELAYELAFAEDGFRTFKGHRAFAMMHLAMHDATNAVTPRYRQHTFTDRDSSADGAAAAAQAGHDVLLALYPAGASRLEAELHRTLAEVPDEGARSRGVLLGRRAAAAHLAARRDDGWDLIGTYEFRDVIGAYRSTPPWNGFVLQPGFRHARPFGLTMAAQFRPPPPPALTSPAYATALNEVRRFGGLESRERTKDQTAYAIWWMEFVEGSVNRLARRLAVERQLSTLEAARLFALLNVSLYDTYIAVWDTKYEYNHWRPYSAIREAADDGNPETPPEPTWQPLRPTPPFPEYISAHAAACAAMFAVLRRELGDRGPFAFATTTAPEGMPTRRFVRFGAATSECADSRVRLGWHFRYATNAGVQLGNAVAAFVAGHHLGPQRDAGGTRPFIRQ